MGMKFNQEIFDKICDRLAEGESLRKICKDKDLPHARDVSKWLDEMPEIRPQYARARDKQHDFWAQQIMEIADEDAERDADGRRDPAHVAQKRLQIDSRKWLLSKLAPKKYGDVTTIKGDGESPLVINVVKPSADDQSA